MGANIFQRPQTFLSKREHFSWGANIFFCFLSRCKGGAQTFLQAANIYLQMPRVGANIFDKGRKHFHMGAKMAQSFQSLPIVKSKMRKEQSKVQKAKVKRQKKVILCHPQALRMPLYKECKKLFISSSSPIIIISHFRFPLPSQQNPPPPHLSPPMGGHDNAKRAQKECNCFAKP
jgi:hypothetical protein